jgi:hypothetical protein
MFPRNVLMYAEKIKYLQLIKKIHMVVIELQDSIDTSHETTRYELIKTKPTNNTKNVNIR